MINNHNAIPGSASVYLNVNANNNVSTLDNSGSYYSLSNGQTLPVNSQVFSGWADRASFSIDVEKSGPLSPYLGLVSVSQVFTSNTTGYYTTETGNVKIGVSNNVTAQQMVSLTNDQIANYYRPDLYLANKTSSLQSQTIFTPDYLYYRILSGYDSEIGQKAMVLEYLYYWPNETDNFGSSLGHYYDFAPVFIYIRNFGDSPYRIVFETQNPSLTSHLPAYLEIYSEIYSSSLSTIGTFNVSTDLTPILGINMTTNYEIYPISTYYSSTNYENRSSEFPLLTNPIMMALDTYHNLEFGNGSSQLTAVRFSTPLVSFADKIIFHYYQLLNEAFNSQLHDYSWNNYVVPYNLSLTLDMLYNPFTKPFFIDCFENVAHENAQARTNTESNIFGSVLVDTSVIIPATITIAYPTQMQPNGNDSVSVSIHMDQNNVLVLFNYLINLSTSLNLYYLTKNVTMNFKGGISVRIPLQTISSFQQKTGLNSISDPHTFGNYFTINNVYFNAGLLGTIFNASVSINLYKILEDMVNIYQPEIYPVFRVLNLFLSAINLDLTPSLEGLVIGKIASTDPSSASLSGNSFTLNAQDKPQTIGIHTSANANTGSKFKLKITNYLYAMNFTNTWSISIVPSKLIGLFVSGIQINLGIYPNIQSTVGGSSNGAVDSKANSIQTQDILIQVPSQSSSSSKTSDGFTILALFVPLMAIYVFKRKKRSKI